LEYLETFIGGMCLNVPFNNGSSLNADGSLLWNILYTWLQPGLKGETESRYIMLQVGLKGETESRYIMLQVGLKGETESRYIMLQVGLMGETESRYIMFL
jgi:hypothetical protein